MDQGNIQNMKYYHKTNVMSRLLHHVDTMENFFFFFFSLVTILQIGLFILLVPKRLFKVKH